MVVPRGLMAAVQVIGYTVGMAGVPCVEYSVVGRLRAALLRELVAVVLYGAVLWVFVALIADFQGGGPPGQGGDIGGTVAVLGWLLSAVVLLSCALAYSAPRLDPRPTLHYLSAGTLGGTLLIGACAAAFLLIGGGSALAAIEAAVIVMVGFFSAGFAFLIVPLVAPRSGSPPVAQYGILALLLGCVLAILPHVLLVLGVQFG